MRKVLILTVAVLLMAGGSVLLAGPTPNPGPSGSTTSVLDAVYCRLAGCDMAGDIDMNGNEIDDSTGPLNLGTAATTSHGLVSGGVIFGGTAEFDAAFYADAGMIAASNTYLGAYGNNYVRLNANLYGQFLMASGVSSGMQLVLANNAHGAMDYGHSAGPDFALYIQSGSSETTWHLKADHDRTNGVISTGAGLLSLTPATSGVELPKIEDASPSAPVTCNATNTGVLVYADDNDDTAIAELCVCLNLNDSTYDWRQVATPGTACSFF